MQDLLQQAVTLHGQGRLDEAERIYNRILAANPNLMDARHMLGVLKAQQRRPQEAYDLIAPVVQANPRDALALANLGNVLNDLERLDEALDAYDRALAINPNYPPAWLSRGNVLTLLLRYGEAVESYNRALGFDPGNPDAWNGRGLALQNTGRLEEALDSFRRAEALDPGFAQAFLNRGLCHMLMRDFASGLPLMEWRKRMPAPLEARAYPQPLWTGAEKIRGKTVFVYIEQGLGDTIQYYRYLDFLLARGAKVVLSVWDRLIALLRKATPQVELIGWGKVPPSFDYHIPLASIPLAVGMRFETIPAVDHYLAAEPERVAQWKEKLGDHGFRIGIAWQGNQLVMGSEGKAFPVAALQYIAALAGVRLIALQKNAGSEQLAGLPSRMAVESYDFDEGADAFLDTAAIMMNCDLVITADTAPAHLAGALGVPAWVALKHVPDWRWFLERADSPWYPSLRLFRQPATGDWAGVFQAMEAELISRSRRS
ncbi:MAG TPA: tetratricopeptide repeat-containing glycosyltransferase family protein [Rhizomicrobium sp.]|nr:tetratricopeptide repeat-containing glycosyltransferase family protein [Rhizomicrobium sp.]